MQDQCQEGSAEHSGGENRNYMSVFNGKTKAEAIYNLRLVAWR